MKPTAFRPAGFNIIGAKTVWGILLACALALIPTNTFAQRGAAGAHAGGARAGAVRAPQAPVVRAPAPVVSHPTGASPIINRPIVTRPGGVGMNPVTAFRTPIMPVRPITGSGIFFPTRPPLRTPIRPIGTAVGLPGRLGLGYSPLFFWGCNPFWGFAYGCGIGTPPGFGYGGYIPPTVYPGPTYPPDPGYSPSEPSATLQYTPLTNQYPPLESFPAENLSATSNGSARLRNEVLIYLKEGSVFAVASYTVSDGQLHYVTTYGDKNDLSLELLDLQKTIEMNAERGVAFTLTPAPDSAPGASAPAPLGPAPAPPGPITPAKP